MTTTATSSSQYVDLHNANTELTVDEYLSKDLIRNWHSAWKNTTVNPKEFIEYRGSIEVRRRLWYNRYVTICGYPGDGKTSIADNIARYFAREPLEFPTFTGHYGEDRHKVELARNEYAKLYIEDEGRDCYDSIHVSSPKEYNEKVNPDIHQLVIIDDIFGEAIMDWGKIESWRPYLEELFWNLMTTECKTLVVVCVNKAHLQRLPSDVRQLEWFKPGALIDLNRKDSMEDEFIMKMTNYSRVVHVKCLRPHFKDTPLAKKKQYVQELNRHRGHRALESANLLYRIRNLVSKFELLGEDFFKKPWEYCLNEIDQIFKVDKILYYTLSVIVLLDGKLYLDKGLLMEYEGRVRQVIEQLITLLDVPLDVSLSKMRFAAKLLSGFFLLQVGKYQWEITHARIYSLCLSSLIKQSTNGIIELLSVNTICKYVRIGQDLEENQNENELAVMCPIENYDVLAQRFMVGIVSGQMRSLVSNECFQDKHFATVFYDLVKGTGCLGEVVYQKDQEFGRTFFYWACHYGQGHLVKSILLETEAINIKNDARFKDEFRYGYLAACVNRNRYSFLVLKTLFEETGVRIERGDKNLINKLTEALGQDLCYLLSMEAPILHIACLKGNHASVEYLIEQGADVEEPGKDGMRAIHRTAGRNDREGPNVVKCLIQNRVDIETKNARQFTALDMAIESGTEETVRHLVMAGADINKLQGDNESSYMCRAIQRQDYELVSFLFSKKVKINGHPGKDMFPPLCHAAQSGKAELVNELKYRSDIDMNRSGCNGWSALHAACYMGDKALVENLLTEDETDVNCKDYTGNTALHLAAGKGGFEICEILLRKGAKPEIMNIKRETPLVCAARGNHATVTWLLLRDGMNLESDDRQLRSNLFSKV